MRDTLHWLLLIMVGVAVGTLIALAVAYYVSKDAIDQKLNQVGQSTVGKLLGIG